MQRTTDNRSWFLDLRWVAAMVILAHGVVMFAAGTVIGERFDPNDDHLEPAYTIRGMLGLAGMALPLVSAIPIRHIGWWLIPYVVVAYLVGFAVLIALLTFAVLISAAW
jgi:hypothetical protein